MKPEIEVVPYNPQWKELYEAEAKLLQHALGSNCTFICEKKPREKVKLADGKERTIQHMISTTFWHPEETPMSAQQFMEHLFGELPEFFKSEEELRSLWSKPDTRKKLLQRKILTVSS